MSEQEQAARWHWDQQISVYRRRRPATHKEDIYGRDVVETMDCGEMERAYALLEATVVSLREERDEARRERDELSQIIADKYEEVGHMGEQIVGLLDALKSIKTRAAVVVEETKGQDWFSQNAYAVADSAIHLYETRAIPRRDYAALEAQLAERDRVIEGLAAKVALADEAAGALKALIKGSDKPIDEENRFDTWELEGLPLRFFAARDWLARYHALESQSSVEATKEEGK